MIEKNWFYYGFKFRYNLRYVRLSGASRKLPKGWEGKVAEIITRVGRRQVSHLMEGLVIPAIQDDSFANTDHIPVYRDMPSNYSWVECGTGNKHVATGGAEKERFTVQLTCLKSGRKLPPFIIFKGASPPINGQLKKNTVAYELKHRLDDNAGNKYPAPDDIYMTCSKTANSSGELTIEILREVIFPAIGIFDGKVGGVLVDDFKGHSRDIVKDYVTSFKSGNATDNDAER